MSCGCGNNCGGSGAGSVANMQEQLSDLQSVVDSMSASLQAFISGHPILMINDASDIALFNIGGDNKGIGAWLGWALCDGGSYPNASATANITTPNLLDKFVVGALGSYSVGDTGGSNTVSLTAAQNGQHSHTIVDGGHTHNLTDPGHVHAVTDPQHSHTGSSTPHTHSGTTTTNGAHIHESIGSVLADVTGGTESVPNLNVGGASFSDHLSGGDHTHDLNIDATSVSVTTNNASTGISVNSNTIGITETDGNVTGISINDSGTGDAHENRPPYYALIYVMKIF